MKKNLNGKELLEIREELNKCREDVVYFYENYFMVNGEKPAPLRDYEKEFMRQFSSTDYKPSIAYENARRGKNLAITPEQFNKLTDNVNKYLMDVRYNNQTDDESSVIKEFKDGDKTIFFKPMDEFNDKDYKFECKAKDVLLRNVEDETMNFGVGKDDSEMSPLTLKRLEEYNKIPIGKGRPYIVQTSLENGYRITLEILKSQMEDGNTTGKYDLFIAVIDNALNQPGEEIDIEKSPLGLTPKTITVLSEPIFRKGQAGRSGDSLLFTYEGDIVRQDILLHNKKRLYVKSVAVHKEDGTKSAIVMNVDINHNIKEFGIKIGDKLQYLRNE